MTLANISRLANAAIGNGGNSQVAPIRVQAPNKAYAESQSTPISTISAATFAQDAVQTRPALPGLAGYPPSAPAVVLPPPPQPGKPPTPQPLKPPVKPKGFTPGPVGTITPFKTGGTIPNTPPSTQNPTFSPVIPNGPSQFKDPPPRAPSSVDVPSRPRNDTTYRSPEHVRNIGLPPLTEPSKSPSRGYDSYRPAGNTQPVESPHRDPPRDCQRPGNPPSMTPERLSRWDLKDNPNTSRRETPKPTEATPHASFPNNNNQNPNSLAIPPPSGPRSYLIPKNAAATNGTPTAPLFNRTNTTLSEKLEARLSLESTLKITAGKTQSFHQLNLQTLLTALKLPNLLRLEVRNSTLYVRLLDSIAAHRIACNYKNFKPDTPPEHQKILNSIKLYSPSDYAPVVSGETINAWRRGARRMLVTSSFALECRRSQGEYDEFVGTVTRLGGYFSFSRNGGGKVWIGFDGVENCVTGKAILERKYNDVYLHYSEELAKGDL